MVIGDDGALPLPWLQSALTQSLELSKAHALLIHGAAGDGALQLALSLAQSWLCEDLPAGSVAPACGRCGSCRQVAARAHPDLLVLLPESLQVALGWTVTDADAEAGEGGKGKRKPSRQVRIDAVRAAIDWTSTTPSRGRAKVVVIHPADALNLQAGNALLKTLEEPPRGARLILTSGDPEHLLPTVRSRCQRVRLVAPDAAVAVPWLVGQGVGDAEVLLRAMDGHPLDAAVQARAGLSARVWNELPRAIARGHLSHVADWPLPLVIDALLKLCHDGLSQAVGATPRFFGAQDMPPVSGLGELLAWKAQLTRAARFAEHPWSEGLLVEALLAGAPPSWRRAALDTLRA